MNALCVTAKEYGMKLNIKKTKVMIISKKRGEKINTYVDRQKLEQVDKFKYLGSWITVFLTDDGRCEVEIKSRIAMVKHAAGIQ